MNMHISLAPPPSSTSWKYPVITHGSYSYKGVTPCVFDGRGSRDQKVKWCDLGNRYHTERDLVWLRMCWSISFSIQGNHTIPFCISEPSKWNGRGRTIPEPQVVGSFGYPFSTLHNGFVQLIPGGKRTQKMDKKKTSIFCCSCSCSSSSRRRRSGRKGGSSFRRWLWYFWSPFIALGREGGRNPRHKFCKIVLPSRKSKPSLLKR
jgi:hypothetical protein